MFRHLQKIKIGGRKIKKGIWWWACSPGCWTSTRMMCALLENSWRKSPAAQPAEIFFGRSSGNAWVQHCATVQIVLLYVLISSWKKCTDMCHCDLSSFVCFVECCRHACTHFLLGAFRVLTGICMGSVPYDVMRNKWKAMRDLLQSFTWDVLASNKSFGSFTLGSLARC